MEDSMAKDKLKKAKIVIAELDKNLSKILKRTLKRDGFENLVEVGKEEEVLALALTENKFDLLFLDIKLANKDDFQLLKEIKRILPSTNVIIITKTQNYDICRKAFIHGASDVFSKPLENAEVIASVRRLLEKTFYSGGEDDALPEA